MSGPCQIQGQCGKDYDVEQGSHAAKVCGIQILSQLKAACGGDLDQVEQVAFYSDCVRSAVIVIAFLSGS